MKPISSLVVGLIAVFLIGTVKINAQDTSPIWIKGPIHIASEKPATPNSTVGTATIGFAKAPTAAGENGVNLKPGQGAWVDRPLNATEPAKIRFLVDTTDAATIAALRKLENSPSALMFSVHNSDGFLVCAESPYRAGSGKAGIVVGDLLHPVVTSPDSPTQRPAQAHGAPQAPPPAANASAAAATNNLTAPANALQIRHFPKSLQVKVYTPNNLKKVVIVPQATKNTSQAPLFGKTKTFDPAQMLKDSNFIVDSNLTNVLNTANQAINFTRSSDPNDLNTFVSSEGICSVPPASSNSPDASGQHSQNPRDMTCFSVSDGVIYPGALLMARTLDTIPQPIVLPSRPPMAITVEDLPGPGPVSGTMSSPTNSQFETELSKLLQGKTPQPSSSGAYSTSYASAQVAMSLGVQAGYMGAQLQASVTNLDFNSESVGQGTFNEKDFTVVVDSPPTPSSVFAKGTTVGDLQKASSMYDEHGKFICLSPIAYVSSVTYGRQGVIFFQSTASRSDLKFALSASFSALGSGGSVSTGIDVTKVANHTQASVLLRGGSRSAQGKASASLSDVTTAATGFNAWLAEPVNAATVNEAVPISYVVNYLKDNSVAAIHLIANYPVSTPSPSLSQWDVLFSTNQYYVPGATRGLIELRLKTSQGAPDPSSTARYAYADLITDSGSLFPPNTQYLVHLHNDSNYSGPAPTMDNKYLFDLVITTQSPVTAGVGGTYWTPDIQIFAGNDSWQDTPQSQPVAPETSREVYAGVYDVTNDPSDIDNLNTGQQIGETQYTLNDEYGQGYTSGLPLDAIIDLSDVTAPINVTAPNSQSSPSVISSLPLQL